MLRYSPLLHCPAQLLADNISITCRRGLPAPPHLHCHLFILELATPDVNDMPPEWNSRRLPSHESRRESFGQKAGFWKLFEAASLRVDGRFNPSEPRIPPNSPDLLPPNMSQFVIRTFVMSNGRSSCWSRYPPSSPSAASYRYSKERDSPMSFS